MRTARATSWAEFSQAEVDAMAPSMRHAITTKLATQAAAAAKAKARAEAEEIAREVSRRKKAEHDAKVYLRPLRGPCQDDGISVSLASAARNSETAVELFGRTRPPLQARARLTLTRKGRSSSS